MGPPEPSCILLLHQTAWAKTVTSPPWGAEGVGSHIFSARSPPLKSPCGDVFSFNSSCRWSQETPPGAEPLGDTRLWHQPPLHRPPPAQLDFPRPAWRGRALPLPSGSRISQHSTKVVPQHNPARPGGICRGWSLWHVRAVATPTSGGCSSHLCHSGIGSRPSPSRCLPLPAAPSALAFPKRTSSSSKPNVHRVAGSIPAPGG